MQNKIFIQTPSEGLVISRLVNSESIRQIFIEEASADYDYGVVLDTSCAGQLLYANCGSRKEAEQTVSELCDILGIKVVKYAGDETIVPGGGGIIERKDDFKKRESELNDRLAEVQKTVASIIPDELFAKEEHPKVDRRVENVKKAAIASAKARHERAIEIKRKESELMKLKAKNGYKTHNGKPLDRVNA